MKRLAADMDGWILELARQGSLSRVVTHIKVRVRVQFVDHRSDLGIFGVSYQRKVNKRMMETWACLIGPGSIRAIAWRVLATLNLTLATLSVAIWRTVGRSCLSVMSAPQAYNRILLYSPIIDDYWGWYGTCERTLIQKRQVILCR